MPVTDGWINAFQMAIRERATRTVSTLDSPFAQKSAQTLNDLADYAGTLGREDPHLHALHLIGAHQGDSDSWAPGSQQASTLAGAGFGTEGITPSLLLGELIDKGIEDLADEFRRQQQRGEAGIAQARAEALEAVAEEKRDLIAERDQARADLDAERHARREADRQLDHLTQVLNSVRPPKPKPRKVKRTGAPTEAKALKPRRKGERTGAAA